MKIRSFVLPAVLLLAATGGYLLGRQAGSRKIISAESRETTASGVSQSMLGQSRNSLAGKTGLGNNTVVSEALGPRDFIDALIATQKAVPKEHMSLAILKAGEEPDPVKSNLMFAQLLQLLTPENALAALESLVELPRSSLVDNQARLFRYAWGQVDGPAAAENVATMKGRSGSYAAYSVMAGWSSADPEAAIAWVDSLEEEEGVNRGRYYRGIVSGLAKHDPKLATRFALERHAAGDSEADDYIASIAREQFRRGIDVATAWVETVMVTELKQDAVYRVAREYVDLDPAEAAAWVRKYATTQFGVQAVGEVAEEWAEEDAPSAVNWVAGLPVGEARTQAFKEVFNEWTEDDPFTAADYLVAMPNGADRDAAVAAFSRRHVRGDPEAAITWAASIGDEAQRLSSLKYTGQQWMRREPDKAEAWLATSGLPEEIQHQIRALAPQQIEVGTFFRESIQR